MNNTELYQTTMNNEILLSAQIELTTMCNWKCQHCYIPEEINNNMTMECLISLLVDLREMGVFDIIYTGGEIFIRKNILEIISLTRRMGFRVFLYSNLSLLDEKIIEQLKELYVSEISCTIFSMNHKVHDSITHTTGSLKKTLENLVLLKDSNISIEVKTMPMNNNYLEWEKIMNFSEKMGFSFRIDEDVFAKINGDNSTTEWRLSKKKLKNYLKASIQKIPFFPHKHSSDEFVCSGIRNSIFIASNGDVFPCVKLREKVGNITRKSIKSIWEESEKLKELRNKKWESLRKCSLCKLEEYCSFCPGMALSESCEMDSCYSHAFDKAKFLSKI